MKKYFVYFDVIHINKHNFKLVNIIIIKKHNFSLFHNLMLNLYIVFFY